MSELLDPFLQSLYGASKSNISQEPKERGILFTCMDPRLNHMLSMVWGDQFMIRHAGGFVCAPGDSHNIDNAFRLAMGAGLHHVISITHTDCLAVQAAKPDTHVIDDKTITKAWHACTNPNECPEQVADKALQLAIVHIKAHGWRRPIYGLKCDSSTEMLSVFDPKRETLLSAEQLKTTPLAELTLETSLPEWLLKRVIQHNQHVGS